MTPRRRDPNAHPRTSALSTVAILYSTHPLRVHRPSFKRPAAQHLLLKLGAELTLNDLKLLTNCILIKTWPVWFKGDSNGRTQYTCWYGDMNTPA